MNTSIEGPVLVTGGAGYIGGQTVLALLDAGVEVSVLDDLSTGKVRPFHSDVTFYEGKIHDGQLIENILQRHNIKSILHFAGSIKVDESVSNPLKYYYNNTEGSRVLIELAVRCGVHNFIFSSTAAVYGETGTAPVGESHPATPLNPYGSSKLFTEQQLKDACRVSGMRFGIYRYFNVAGADPNMRHGQFMKDPSHLMGRAINAALGRAGPLTIFGKDLTTPDGTGVRDYIHVFDVASAHLALLEDLQKNGCSRLLNLGYGKGTSVLEVVSTLETLLGRGVPYSYGEPRPGEAPSVVADIGGLRSQLTWKPRYQTVTDMLQSAYDWVSKLEDL